MNSENIITRERMIEPLLEADRSIAPLWATFVEEWGGEPNPPLYLALSGVARHLIGQLKAGDTSSFRALFDVLQGDSYVREAASVGLLEDLQNTSLHDATEPKAFEPWLRPESKRWWDKVDRFWSRGEPLTEA